MWMVSLWVDGFGLGQAPTALLGPNQVERANRQLHGQILAFTRRHGHDSRIWSPALNERRDLLVYLPPGYDPAQRYPLTIFLHGAGQDEQIFLQAMVPRIDRAMAQGLLPLAIVAAPDGSVQGRPTRLHVASFWADSRVGNFEQYLMIDVWNFLMEHFAIRPEREAHSLIGVSMGGSAAMALGIKHRDRIRTVVAMMPLLNLRHVSGEKGVGNLLCEAPSGPFRQRAPDPFFPADCHGHYRTPFDPECSGLREKARPCEKLGRRKLFCLRFKDLFVPLFGRGQDMVAGMSSINPLELMIRHDLKPGELDIYVGYGEHDEFNVGAQVEGFLYVARQRGIEATVDRDAEGRHNLATGQRLFQRAMPWMAARAARRQ